MCQPFQPTPRDALPRVWHLDRLQMHDVWQIATGEGITVGVIDTAVSPLGSVYLNAQG